MNRRSLRRHLRNETRDLHDRLDSHFAGCDPARRADLLTLLSVHWMAVPPLEQALAAWSSPWGAGLHAGLPLTRALRADLTALKAPLPRRGAAVRPPVTPAALLGTAYVLTGSRLGNRGLRSRWAAGGAGVADAGAYLSWEDGERAWPGLVRHLDAWGRRNPDSWADALSGARAAFASFLEAAGLKESEAA